MQLSYYSYRNTCWLSTTSYVPKAYVGLRTAAMPGADPGFSDGEMRAEVAASYRLLRAVSKAKDARIEAPRRWGLRGGVSSTLEEGV